VSISAGFASDDQIFFPHSGAGFWKRGRQTKRIGPGKVGSVNPPGAIRFANQQNRKRRPIRADCARMGTERSLHGGLDAIDMDMQLILRAPIDRVDRQAEFITLKDPADTLVDIVAGVPRPSPVVRRIR